VFPSIPAYQSILRRNLQFPAPDNLKFPEPMNLEHEFPAPVNLTLIISLACKKGENLQRSAEVPNIPELLM